MAAKTAPRLPAGFLGLGLGLRLRRDFLPTITDIASRGHDLCWARLGPVRLYFVNHPDLIHEVLVTKNRSFRKLARQTEAFRRVEGEGLVVSEGDFWLRQRRLVQPAFHTARFGRYGEIVVEHTLRMLGTWSDGLVLPIADAMTHLTMAIIARALFDVDVTDQAPHLAEALAVLGEVLRRDFNSVVLLPAWLPLPSNRRRRRALRVLDEFMWRTLRERRSAGTDRGDLLSMLLLAVDEQGGREGMTDRQVRDEALTLFYAGHDSSAAGLAWLWYNLGRHPEIEAKLLAEVDGVLAGRPPRYEDVPRLPYAERVIKESLRLYPPAVALFGRVAVEDVEIGGHAVPRGAYLHIFPWVTHRDGRFFPNPNVFDPDRFAPGAAERIPPSAWIPFGAGPHGCIGHGFALMEMVLIVATVLQRYRLALAVPPEAVVPEVHVFSRPRGLLVRALRRPEPVGQ
jgi:cytochrome P450